MRWILALSGLLATAAGAVATAGFVLSGAQPWGPTLSDNMVFARAIPFVLGLGVLVGALVGFQPRIARGDGDQESVQRFSPFSRMTHWLTALSLIIGGVTGAWQYLKGVLDVESPVFMPYVYRLHYLSAALLLFAIAAGVTYWWIRGPRLPVPEPGGRIRHWRGLAHELPRPLGGLLAGFLGLNMKRQAPAVGQYTFYETTISFPSWTFVVGLLALTGIVKAMRYLYPIPGELLYWISAVHVAGLVLFAVKLLDHLRYVLTPSRWPLAQAMLSGKVSSAYVRARHPGWWDEIRSERPVSAPTSSSTETTAAPKAAV